MNLTKLSIQRPILVIVLFLVLGILGLFSYKQLRYELLPNIATPYVSVVTFYPGASPTEIENTITRRIEEAVSTAGGIKMVTSQSLENVSLVNIEYRQGTNAELALQEAQRKVNEVVASLPANSKAPTVSKYSLSDLPVLRLAATSQLPPLEFGHLLKNRIRPRLTQTPGVGQVTFIGLPEAEVRVLLNADRLRTLNLSVLQVVDALRTSNLNVPSGQVRDTDATYSVRVVGKTDALDRLRDVVVYTTPTGQKVRLGTVASIEAVAKETENINRFWTRDDRSQTPTAATTVGITLTKQTGANNVELSETVRALLTQFEKEYAAEGLRFQVAQDASEFTLAAADGVNHDLLTAIGLVALVMFVFLHSLRSSLIVLVAIPASLLSTFLFMNILGFSLNLLTLLALSLVIGILVDDSIVVLESINGRLENGEDNREAALNGRNEIGFAALAITLVDVVVFVPLSVVPGLVGDILREFSLVVVIATLFSLLVSFTLTPMIASRFGQVEHLSKHSLMGRFGLWFEGQFERLTAWYRSLLAGALHYRKTTIGFVALLFVASLTLPMLGFVGGEFTPPTDKGEVSVTLQFAEGQRLEQTNALARQLETSLRDMPEVWRVFTNVGANPEGFGITSASNSVEFAVTFSPSQERAKNLTTLTREIRERAARLPGVQIKAYPIGILGSDGATPIVLVVNGVDRAKVHTEAARIVSAMQQIPGTADVRFSGNVRKPEVQIEIDREKLARYGLTTDEVGTAVRTALAGFDDLTIQQGDVATTLRVQYAESFRSRTAQLGQMTLLSARGRPVLLREVARLRETANPAVLERKDRNNSVTITSQAIGRPVGDIGDDIRRELATLNVDPSVRVVLGGDLELQDDSFGKLGLAFVAAILFMYLIMVALYNSWLYPFVVLFSIPVAVIGALLALALSMNSLNIFTILGMIMMLGLVAKNAILLVEKANQNREAGLSTTDALLDAGQTRLRPILMTTLAMVVGMLPIALATGPGAELKTGLAWALVGGLSSSMFLTLVFVPVVYVYVTRLSNWLSRIGPKKAQQQSARPETMSAGLSVVAFLLLSATAFGQELPRATVPATVSLSLNEAAEQVRRHNGEVRVAQYDEQRADARLDEVRRSWWPTLNAEGTYQYNIRPPVFFFPAFNIDPTTGEFAFDNNRLTPVEGALRHAYAGGINLAMPLVQPDLRLARKQAQTARQVASENSRAAVNRQVAEVKKTYLNVLLAQEQQILVRQSMARAQTLLTEARNRYRLQLATDADTLRAYVEVENLRPGLSKLDRSIRLLTRQLTVLMGLDQNTKLVLTDSLRFNASSFVSHALADQAAMSNALSYRPELRQLALNLDQTRQQAEAERLRRLPGLSLFGQLSTQAQLPNFRFSNSQWPTVAYLGLQLTIPLVNPTTSARLQQARLGFYQAQEQIRYTKKLVANEVQAALDAEAEARERIEAQAGVVRAAERSYTLVRSRYQQGIATFTELTDAELALRQAQSNRVQAIYDLLTAQVERDRATGQN